VIILTIFFCTLLCSGKILECKNKNIFDIGFVDPQVINEEMLIKHRADTEYNLLLFLRKLNTKTEILFPYNFK